VRTVTTLDMTSAMCGDARCRSLIDAGEDYALIGAVAVPFGASWSPNWPSSSTKRTNFSPRLSWPNNQVGPVGPVGGGAYGDEEGNSYVVVGRSRIDCKCILENSATRFGTLRRADSAARCRRMSSSAPVLRPRNTERARERRVDRYYDPSTDQFISVDPDVAETGQPYAFTGDDPVNGTDPMGRNCQAPTGDACAVSPAGVFASEPGQSPSQPMTQVQGPSTASQQIDQQVSQFCSGSNASFCQALLEYPAGTPQGDCLRGGPCTVAQGADPVVALSTQAENDALPGYVAKLPPASPMSQPAPSGGFNFFKLFECVEISVDTVGAASLAGTVGTVAVGLAPESGGLSLIGLSSAGGIASGAGAMGFVAYQECSNL
jgi:hypothetical protein